MSNFGESCESGTISSDEALKIQKPNVRKNMKSDTSLTVSSNEAEKIFTNFFRLPKINTQQNHLDSSTFSSSEAERIRRQKVNFLYTLFTFGGSKEEILAGHSSPTVSSYDDVMKSINSSPSQTRLQIFTINIDSSQNPPNVPNENSIETDYCKILATDYKNPAFILNNINTKLLTKTYFVLSQKWYYGLLLLLLLSASVISTLLVIIISKKQVVLIRRNSWDALPSKSALMHLTLGNQPKIILTQTNDELESCTTQSQCMDRIRKLQLNFMNDNMSDIPYNFLIGDDGFVYEGRGFDFKGEIVENQFSSSFNDVGLIIAFIGNFNDAQPSERQFKIFQRFLLQSIKRDGILRDYTLLLQDQLTMSEPDSAGLLAALSTLNEFHNVQPVINRAMWDAADQKDPELVKKFTELITDVQVSQSAYFSPCLYQIFEFQVFDFDVMGMTDIAENFLITPCGIVEGRGWDTKSDSDSLIIRVLGEMQKEVLDNFLLDGFILRKLSIDANIECIGCTL